MRVWFTPLRFPSAHILLLVASGFVATTNRMYGQSLPFSLDSRKAITQYAHKVWQKEQGLPQNSVNVILQRRSGYLMLGTQEGFAQFDGVKFTVFNKRHISQLKTNYVWSLCEDSKGRLWVGTNGGGLSCITGGACRTFTTNEGLSGNVVWSVYEDHQKSLWVTTDGGLNRFVDTAQPSFTKDTGFDSLSVPTVYEDNNFNVWVGTRSGLYRVHDGTISAVRFPGDPAANNISSFLQDKSGTYWVGTNKGLRAMSAGNSKEWLVPPELRDVIIFCIRQDSAGTLWFGTGGKGLWRFAHGVWSNFTTADGLSDNQVRSLFVDREGSLWIGTYGGGLNKLSEGKFASYSTQEGLSHDFVLAVCEASNGSLWIGTYGGGLNRLTNQTVIPVAGTNSLKMGIVTALCADRSGTMWVGIHGAGVYEFNEGGIVRSLGRSNGLEDLSTSALFEDRNGHLWIGTQNGLFRLNEGIISKMKGENNPLSYLITYISEDHESNILVGTHGGGLYTLRDGVFTRQTKKEGLSSDIVTAIHEDSDKTLWLGTDGGGLQKVKDGKFFTYSISNGLFDDVVYTILEDASGYFWMSSNNGIFRVRKQELNDLAEGKISQLACASYSSADGMKSSECNGRRQPSAWKDRNGRLWFATLKGVVVVDPENLKSNTQPPPVTVEEVVVDGVAAPAVNAMEIAPGNDNVEFDYTALSLVAPERVRFKYRLEGFDKSWIDAGYRRTAYYTKLPPGTFRFKVIACNNDGVWNEAGASLEIHFLPYFYQTRLFYLAAMIAFAGLVAGLFFMRVQQMRRRERQLLALVDERTRGLFDEKKKAEEALLQTEQARNEAEKQREIAEEANKVKSQLLSLAAHDLKSPLISVKGFTQIIKEETDKESSVGKMAEMIYTLSNSLLTLVNQLLSSAAIESGTISLMKHRVDLSQLAQSVVRNHFEAAKEKGQALAFQPDSVESCVVDVDEARLRDAMDNLVTNAIKYSPKGKRIWVTLRKKDSFLQFSVRDEGPGLTEDDKRRLFNKFQRLSARPTGGEHSTGLGLSLAKQIIELHGGSVFVESSIGSGSTFTIELPMSSLLTGERR